VGISAPPPEASVSIVDVAPLVLAHFGVEIPGYALGRAA
jgi:predicted AlkP superfamily phosphohydrolase/phosphomutase